MSFGFNTKRLLEPNTWTSIGFIALFTYFTGALGVDPLKSLSTLPLFLVKGGCFIGIAGTVYYLISRLVSVDGVEIWKRFT